MTKRLREYRMRFEAVSPDEEAVTCDAHGRRSKLGGDPDWEQSNEIPVCPHCHRDMIFVGQIDSIEHDAPGNPHRISCFSRDQEYMFGDVGLIYIFFCFECCESRSVFQCG